MKLFQSGWVVRDEGGGGGGGGGYNKPISSLDNKNRFVLHKERIEFTLIEQNINL